MIPQSYLLNEFKELISIEVNFTSHSINSRDFLDDDSKNILDTFSFLNLRKKVDLASVICFRLDVEALAITDQKEICMIVSMRDQNISVQWWQ